MFDKFAVQKKMFSDYLGKIQEFAREEKREKYAEMLKDFATEMDSLRYNIAIIGNMKRGKSILLNALLGRKDDDISPVKSAVCTAAIVHYMDKSQGNGKEEALVFFNSPEKEPISIPLKSLRNYIVEDNNKNNQKGVKKIEVYGDFPLLNQVVSIVDTPGKGSVHEHHDTLLLEFLPNADAIIFLISADLPKEASEKEFLDQLSKNQKDKIFFVLTKRDTIKNERDYNDVIEWVNQQIASAGLSCEKLYETSALKLFEARKKGVTGSELERIKEESGIAELERDMEKFILESSDKNRILKRKFERIIEETGKFCENALKSAEAEISILDVDTVTLGKEIKTVENEAKKLKQERDKSLKKFDREWTKHVEKFKASLDSKADIIADRIVDKLDKGGLFGAIFASFKITKLISHQVQSECNIIVQDLTEKLEATAQKLNEEIDESICVYAKKQKFQDFASIGGSVVGGAILAGVGYGAYTAIASSYAGIMSSIGAYQGALTAAQTAAANVTATATQTGAISKFFTWLTGWTFTDSAAAAQAAKATAITAQGAKTVAMTSMIGTIVSSAVSIGVQLAVFWLVQKVLHFGLKSLQENRIPGLVEKAISQTADQIEKALLKVKDEIIKSYTEQIDEMLEAHAEKLAELNEKLSKG